MMKMEFTKWDQSNFLGKNERGICRSLVIQWFGSDCVPLPTGKRGKSMVNQARTVQNSAKSPGWFKSQLSAYNLQFCGSKFGGEPIAAYNGLKDCDSVTSSSIES
jgi:hypothetical protein